MEGKRGEDGKARSSGVDVPVGNEKSFWMEKDHGGVCYACVF